MREYELALVLRPDLGEEQVPATMEKVTQFVISQGGSVTEVNQWGRRRLAYPIKSFTEGNYFLAHLQLEPRATAALEATLRVWEEVLRHLLIRKES